MCCLHMDQLVHANWARKEEPAEEAGRNMRKTELKTSGFDFSIPCLPVRCFFPNFPPIFTSFFSLAQSRHKIFGLTDLNSTSTLSGGNSVLRPQNAFRVPLFPLQFLLYRFNPPFLNTHSFLSHLLFQSKNSCCADFIKGEKQISKQLSLCCPRRF